MESMQRCGSIAAVAAAWNEMSMNSGWIICIYALYSYVFYHFYHDIHMEKTS